jgi:hypothetical protein
MFCKGTIKRGKSKIYFSFSEREYFRPKVKGTIKRRQNKELVLFLLSESTYDKVKGTINNSLQSEAAQEGTHARKS